MPNSLGAFTPGEAISVYAVTSITRKVLKEMFCVDPRRHARFVDAAAADHPLIWHLDVTVLNCNARPFVTASKRLDLVWRAYTITAQCTYTDATVEIQAFAIKHDVKELIDIWPNNTTNQPSLLAAAIISPCLTPECGAPVWGGDQLCPACTMRFGLNA